MLQDKGAGHCRMMRSTPLETERQATADGSGLSCPDRGQWTARLSRLVRERTG
jgi:hypothetical protein